MYENPRFLNTVILYTCTQLDQDLIDLKDSYRI